MNIMVFSAILVFTTSFANYVANLEYRFVILGLLGEGKMKLI